MADIPKWGPPSKVLLSMCNLDTSLIRSSLDPQESIPEMVSLLLRRFAQHICAIGHILCTACRRCSPEIGQQKLKKRAETSPLLWSLWCKIIFLQGLQLLLFVYCRFTILIRVWLCCSYVLLLFRLLWWRLHSWILLNLGPRKIRTVSAYLAVISCQRQ